MGGDSDQNEQKVWHSTGTCINLIIEWFFFVQCRHIRELISYFHAIIEIQYKIQTTDTTDRATFNKKKFEGNH